MLMDTKSDTNYDTLNVNFINLVNYFTVKGRVQTSVYHIKKNNKSCSLGTAFVVDGS